MAFTQKSSVQLKEPSVGSFLVDLNWLVRVGIADAPAEVLQYKVKLVCPQFAATPFRIVVDAETKQVEIHFDY